MLLSEKQAQALLTIAQDSIKKNIAGIFILPIEQRIGLVSGILSQQSDKLINVELLKENTDG